MKIAKRIQKLGTETAFAVSAEAAAFAAKGNKVYPFHLGDMNIQTPANVMEAAIKAMKDGKTGYCPNAGIPQLREILAADVSASRGVPYAMENVAIQPGGKPTSFDKQVLRDWLLTSDWNREPPPPRLPDDVVDRTARTYTEIEERLTR